MFDIEIDAAIKPNEDPIEDERSQLDEIDELALRTYARIDGGKRGPQTQSNGTTCIRIKANLISQGPDPVWETFGPQKPNFFQSSGPTKYASADE